MFRQRPHVYSNQVKTADQPAKGSAQRLGNGGKAEGQPQRILVLSAEWMKRPEKAIEKKPAIARIPQIVMNSKVKAIERVNRFNRLPQGMTKSQERDLRRRYNSMKVREERQNRFNRISQPRIDSKERAIQRRLELARSIDQRVNRFDRIPNLVTDCVKTIPEPQFVKPRLILKGPAKPKMTVEQQFEEIVKAGEKGREGRKRVAPKRLAEGN